MKGKRKPVEIIEVNITTSAGYNRFILVAGILLALFWPALYLVTFPFDIASDDNLIQLRTENLERISAFKSEIEVRDPNFSRKYPFILRRIGFIRSNIPILNRVTDLRWKVFEETENQKAPNEKIRDEAMDVLNTTLNYSTPQYPLGSTSDQRNMLFLIYEGMLNCYFPGLLAVFTSLFFGGFLGILGSFPDNKLIRSISRFISKTLLSLPRILFLLVIAAVSGFNIYCIMVTLGILHAPRLSRLLSDQIDVLKQQQFIESGRELGLSMVRLLFKHILFYHCLYLFVIQASFCMADAVFTETMLSYLQFAPKGTSWGTLFRDGLEYFHQGCHWMWFFPLSAIITTTGGFFLIGNSALNLHHLRNQE